MTEEEDSPWWQVDLERSCVIDAITLYNRTDKARENLKDFRVTVLNEHGQPVWETREMDAPMPSVTLSAKGVKGRVIRVQLEGRGVLSLAEVVVTGEEVNEQGPSDLAVTVEHCATLAVTTNHRRNSYHLRQSDRRLDWSSSTQSGGS